MALFSIRPGAQVADFGPSRPAGQSYRDFIATMHLPGQLAAVDPIVASFCGGAVGVLSTLMVVEANNASQQARRRCFYCQVWLRGC